MTHQFPVRVYYEDTDFAGVVYHANYLKFIERARSEYVREMGIDQLRLKEQDGVVFAVRRMTVDFLAPAKFGDDLTVYTTVEDMTPARLVMRQWVQCSQVDLFRAEVLLVCVGQDGKACRLPQDIRTKLRAEAK